VLCDLAVVGSSYFWGLVGQQLDCFVPFTGEDGCLNCLLDLLGLDEVVYRSLGLLDRHQVVSPTLLETGHQSGLGIFGQVYSFFEGVAFHVAVKCLLQHVHLFVQLTGFLMHCGLGEVCGYLF
jgi:hypothetical protein